MSIKKLHRIKAQTVSQKGVLREGLEVRLPHREVEKYIGFPIGERLRQRVEDFLSAHEDIDEETAFALLLHLGAAKAEEDPQSVDPREVLADLKSELTSATSGARKRRQLRLARLVAIASG